MDAAPAQCPTLQRSYAAPAEFTKSKFVILVKTLLNAVEDWLHIVNEAPI
jgi:hypothetical protein